MNNLNLGYKARTLAMHKVFCHDYFKGRADTIIDLAQKVSDNSTMGPIEALDICMQIEAEFPKRLDEFVDRASEHPLGMLMGLRDYLVYVRRGH